MSADTALITRMRLFPLQERRHANGTSKMILNPCKIQCTNNIRCDTRSIRRNNDVLDSAVALLEILAIATVYLLR
jgi:hypothetical protein